MRKILFAILLFMVVNLAQAQKSADLGVWGGVGTSFGDMTQMDLGSSLGFNYGAYVRYNFNQRVAARLQLMNGSIKGVGEFDSKPWSFESKNVSSFSLMAEINFFRYTLGKKETPFTTYLLGGFGVGLYPYDYVPANLKPVVNYLSDIEVVEDYKLAKGFTESVVGLQIPFGFGVKVNLGEKVGVGLELLINRHFTDKIDNLDDPRRFYTLEVPASIDADGVATSAVYSMTSYNDRMHNNDYTAYLGLHFTYKINLSRKACPVYEYD